MTASAEPQAPAPAAATSGAPSAGAPSAGAPSAGAPSAGAPPAAAPPAAADRWRPRPRWAAHAAAAGVAGGLAAGLLEAVLVAARAGVRGGGLRAFPVVLALDVLAGAALAAAAAAALLLACADARLRAAARRTWAARAGDPAARAGFAAGGLAALAAAAGTLAGGIWLAGAVARRIADPVNEPFVAVPLLLATAVALALAAFPLQALLARALAPLARRAPRAVSWIPAAAAAAALAVPLAVLRDPAMRTALQLPTLVTLALAAAAAAAAALLLRRLVARRPAVTGAAAAALAVLAPLTLLVASGPRARAAVAAEGTASAALLAVLERATDRDGDGISPVFGGIDCDDRNPAVHAGAVDYPGNGVDEDCDGADAKPMVVDFGPERAAFPPTARTARNVLLVTIDALRADHVGAYGYRARPTTPRLDAFAAGATLFEHAYSPGSATVRVMPALLAGVHPLGVHWNPAGKSVEMDLANVTIAEALTGAGFATADVDLAQPRPRPGFEQGFGDAFRKTSVPDDVYKAGNAAASAGKVIEWLDTHSGPGAAPFFLWVHFIDPHHPYHPHAETAAFGDDEVGLYDGEIAYTDLQLGKVLDHLEARGLAASTLVVVTSDHGEHFGEHGEHFHARDVWEETIHVPLAMRLPGATPRRVHTPVSTLDVVWTIYDLLNVTAPVGATRPRHGMSLAGAIVTGAEPPPRLLVSAAFDRAPDAVRRVAAIRWPLAVREDTTSGGRTCYDLFADPHELLNLMDARPGECGAISTELAAWRVAVMGAKALPPPRKKGKAGKPAPAAPPPPPPPAGGEDFDE